MAQLPPLSESAPEALIRTRSVSPTAHALAQSAALALGAPAALVAVVHDGRVVPQAEVGPVPDAEVWLDRLYTAAVAHRGPVIVEREGGALGGDSETTGWAAVAIRDVAGEPRGVLAVLNEGSEPPGRAGLRALDALAPVAAEVLGVDRPLGAAEGEGGTCEEKLAYEERLLAVVENLDEGLITADLSGNLLHWNRTALRLHGFSSSEEVQRALPDFVGLFELSTLDGQVLPHEEWPLSRIIAGEKVQGVVLRAHRLDIGWERIVRYGGATALDAGGRPIAFLTLVDVTEQEEANAALQARVAELEAITNTADDLILRFDRELRYRFVNPAAQRTLGLTPAEMMGKTYGELGMDPEVAAERESHLRHVFETGEPYTYEIHLRLSNGEPRVFQSRAVPETYDSEGRVQTLLVVARDVTAQRASDSALRARAAELQAVTDHTEDVIVRFSRDGRLLFVNAALERLTGRPSQSFVGRTLAECELSPDLVERWSGGLRDVFASGAAVDVPYAHEVGGSGRRFIARIAPETRGARGRVETVLLVARDFTALHAATATLRAKATELQTISHHTEDILIRHDREGRHLYVNPALERMTGLPPGHFIGKTNVEIDAPTGRAEAYRDALMEVIESGEPADFTFDVGLPSGRKRYLQARMVPELRDSEGRVETVLVTIRDFTALHEATRAMRLKAAELQSITDHTDDAIARFDRDLRHLFVNPAIERMVGVPPEVFLGRTSLELAPDNPTLQIYTEHLKGVLATGESRDVLLDMEREDGLRHYFHTHIVPERGADGEVETLLVVMRDLSEQYRAIEALREAEERTRGVLDASPDSFFAVDSDWNFTFVNAQAAGRWKVSPESLVGKNMLAEFPTMQESVFYREYERSMRDRTPVLVVGNQRETGQWFEARAFPHGTGIAVFFTDVTARKTAETALIRKEAEMRRLAMVAARTTSGVVITDAEGHVEWVNEGFTRMSGYAPEHIIGKRPGDLLRGPATDPEQEALMEDQMIRGEGFTTEVVKYRKDRTPYWVHLDAQPLRDAAGRLTGFIRIDTDITARREAETALRENEERFRMAIEAAHVGVFELALDTQTLMASPHTRVLFGLSPDGPALTLSEVIEIVHPDDRAGVQRLLAAIAHPAAPNHIEGHCRVVWPDGSHHCLSLRGDVIRDGDGPLRHPARFVGVALDITERRRYENELVAAREEAEAAARLKASLLANMSHEIRTPLTGIIGFAEVLAEEVEGEAAEFTKLIRRSGLRLLETLNSVLDLSRLEAAGLTLVPRRMDLREAADDAAALYGGRAEERGLQLVVEAPDVVEVWADEGALARVLANLLSNAVKFTSRGEILVTISAEGDRGVVSVADTGAGIDPGFLPLLFDEFEQESSGLDRSFEGAGLGLTLTKKLVDLMEGEIAVESQKGAGSTFTVRLPLVTEG